MRRLGALCLFLGLAAPALAADPPAAEETPSIPWYRWLFLGERSKPTPPKPKPEPAARGTPVPVSRESAREAAAKQFDQEQRVYLQRLQAISKIRAVAVEQNDEAMLKRADDLEQQAEDIFKQRTARLTGAGGGADDRAALERGRDDRPATADRTPRRRSTGGNDR